VELERGARRLGRGSPRLGGLPVRSAVSVNGQAGGSSPKTVTLKT